MSPAISAKLAKLPSATRDRVLERAAILIFDAGMEPDAADHRALWLEAGIAVQRELAR